jgi:membrane protein required for colicin V production
MNWLDIVILVILAINVFIGLKMGLIKLIMGIIGMVLGVILAGQFYGQLAERLTFISSEGIANIVAFAIIFLGILIIAMIVAGVIKWAVSLVMLGWVNRLGGAVLGVLMAGVSIAALLAAWVRFFGAGDAITASFLAGVLLDSFPVVLGLLPSEFDGVRTFFQ